MEKKIDEFLLELTALCRKHGLVIAPGCCRVPSVSRMKKVGTYVLEGSHITWVPECAITLELN